MRRLPRYIYVAEILPTSHRNMGIALGQGASKIVGCVLPLLLLQLVAYRAPLSGLSVTLESQAVLRSGGILANTNREHALLLSSRSRVQEQALRGGGGGGVLLHVASDADTKGAIPVEKEELITEADAMDPLHSMGDSEEGLGAGQEGVAQVSVPYLILAISSIVAAALLAMSPDPTDSLCDTALETKLALESPRRSRHSRIAETQPLVSATTPRSSGSSRPPVWV